MPDLLFDRQRAVVSQLLRLIEERRNGETALRTRLDRAEAEARAEGESARQRLSIGKEQELADLVAAFAREQEELKARGEGDLAAEQKEYSEVVRALDREERETREKLQNSMQDLLWAAESLQEAGQKRV